MIYKSNIYLKNMSNQVEFKNIFDKNKHAKSIRYFNLKICLPALPLNFKIAKGKNTKIFYIYLLQNNLFEFHNTQTQIEKVILSIKADFKHFGYRMQIRHTFSMVS